MKLNFQKRFGKKKETESTKVTRVRVIAERRRTRSQSITPPANELAKDIQPPSPTTIKEQVQCDATTMASTTISDESDSSGSQTWDASFVGGLTCDPAQDCETTKRFKELGHMINTKIVELNGKFFNELGDMASTTLEKNRYEMGKMIEKKWNTKDELYDSPFVSCSDVKACMTETDYACTCEDTTAPLPSKYRTLAV